MNIKINQYKYYKKDSINIHKNGRKTKYLYSKFN
jgi:hypothetical protein